MKPVLRLLFLMVSISAYSNQTAVLTTKQMAAEDCNCAKKHFILPHCLLRRSSDAVIIARMRGCWACEAKNMLLQSLKGVLLLFSHLVVDQSPNSLRVPSTRCARP